MTEARAFRAHILDALRGKGAHPDFGAATAGLPRALRGAKPPGAEHSPWQLVEHMRIVQWDILEFCRDAEHVSPEFPRGTWPRTEAPPDASAWKASLAAFRRDLKAMQLLVAKADDLLAPVPDADGPSLLHEALLLADHNAYHLGQLVQIRRLLGAWE